MSERVEYIEIDLPRCANVYGQAPCTAALGVTGEKKCFNSLATCQDRPNYSEESETVRFNVASTLTDVAIISVPNASGVEYTPAVLKLGESMGVRSTLRVNFEDHATPDTGPAGDRYLSDRSYDPYKQGTFWAKWKARFPFLRGAPIRWIQGQATQSIANMETRHFFIDSIEGPNSNGSVTIIAKDVLRFADDKRALAPRLSNGFLSAGITAGATSLTLEPVGIGDAEYPASGKGAIGGEEIVSYTRVGDVCTITRAQNETVAVAHDAGDRFQLCLEYTGQKPSAIFEDLLTNYTKVTSAQIPINDWETETDTYIGRFYSTVIPQPTPVRQLMNELIEQTASSMWWDDRANLIRWSVLKQVEANAAQYDGAVTMRGSFSQKDQPDKRISQVWTYFAQRNPLEPLDDPKNYRSTRAKVDPDSENDNDNEPMVKEIFSRWIATGDSDAADTLNALLLSRYATAPRRFEFSLLRDSGVFEPEPGGGYTVGDLMLQDDEGAPVIVPFQAVSIRPGASMFNIVGEEVIYTETIAPPDPTVTNITIDADENNFNIRSAYDILKGGTTPQPGDTVNVYVTSNVVIGATSTSMYAMRTGTWPAGVTINLFNNGTIHGIGGGGGKGGTVQNPIGAYPGKIGNTGGDALLVEYDLNVDNANGKIYAGGGGGAGGQGSSYDIFYPGFGNVRAGFSGGGGGGGAGRNNSPGGQPGDTTTASPGSIGTVLGGGDGGNLKSYAGAKSGGNGGNAGQSGETVEGVAGGAPGNAIVQSGGTANIISAGDIKGAIV
jgi:hypothetical protein